MGDADLHTATEMPTSAPQRRERKKAVGVCTSCVVWSIALTVFILSLLMTTNIAYYLGDGLCHYVYYCCSYTCVWRCRSWQCYGGDWYSSRPISQDELPPPIEDSTNASKFDGDGGDGESDYWSLVVAASAGSVGSFLIMVATCVPCTGCMPRGTSLFTPLVTGIVIFAGWACHLATIICVGIQFWTIYDDGQWVYNHFRTPQYELIDGSLISYLLNDKYYDWFAGLVMGLYVMLYIAVAAELFYMLLVLLAPSKHAHIHNVYEQPSTSSMTW